MSPTKKLKQDTPAPKAAMLQLPQAYPVCFAETWERTRQGTRVLMDRRLLRGEFAVGSDIVKAVWDKLPHTASRYDPAYTELFARPSLDDDWQEMPMDGAIADFPSDTYKVQLTAVELVEEERKAADKPLPRFIKERQEISDRLKNKTVNPRFELPDGEDFLEAVLAGDYIVDKTASLPDLIQRKWVLFLRPRRFGKSFWVSTLNYFFTGAVELFTDFAVWKKRIFEGTVLARNGRFVWNPTNPQEHKFPPIPVVRLNFSRFRGARHAEEANALLVQALNQQAAQEGIPPVLSFPDFVEALAFHPHNEWKQVVVLIDEYDSLLNANLGPEKREVFEDLRENFVKVFFTLLKSVDPHILFCFVTGVSAFGITAIWSGGNQIRDFSSHERLAAVCGFTHEEARALVSRANVVAPDCFNEFWQVLVDRYNGYRFHVKDIYPHPGSATPVPALVFNPFLIRRIVEEGQYVDDWALTASESVFKYIHGKVLPSVPFRLPQTTLEHPDESPELEDRVKIAKMLFRAGYLTIGQVSNNYVDLVHVNSDTTIALVNTTST